MEAGASSRLDQQREELAGRVGVNDNDGTSWHGMILAGNGQRESTPNQFIALIMPPVFALSMT
jgi:hypothetical protein